MTHHSPLAGASDLPHQTESAAKSQPAKPAADSSDPPWRRTLSAYGPWLIVLALFLLPLLTYWNTTFHHFGLRDDYANLCEAHHEPGKIVHFIASHARLLYGYLLEGSFAQIDSIQGFAWLRLAGALGLGAVSVFLFSLLRQLGWSLVAAAFVAAMAPLTPPAQVIASWATAWPYTVATLLALGGFALADRISAPWKGFGWIGAVALVMTSALTYQPNTLFYLFGVAAALPQRRQESLRCNLRWASAHFAIVFTGLALAFLTMEILYATSAFEASARIGFEHDPLGKLWWFIQEPLPNALNMFVLNDDEASTWRAYITGVGIAGLLLLVGMGVEYWRRGWRPGHFWLLMLVALPPAVYSINLVVADRYAAYRTVFALASVLLVFLTLSWENLCGLAGRNGRWIRLPAYALAVMAAIVLARSHAYSLIAAPQGDELAIVERAASHVVLPPDRPARIYLVQPARTDNPVDINYHDEFGSLSTDNDWLPQKIFEQSVRERFPKFAEGKPRYEIQVKTTPPARNEPVDLMIDMRQIRKLGPLYAGPTGLPKNPSIAKPSPATTLR